MAGPKIIKDPELSMADKMADTTRARQNASAKVAGVSAADMAAHPHLKQSKHFGAPTTPKNPASRMANEKDGLPGAAAAMGKRFIGG